MLTMTYGDQILQTASLDAGGDCDDADASVYPGADDPSLDCNNLEDSGGSDNGTDCSSLTMRTAGVLGQ